MAGFILRRLLISIPIILLASFIVFSVVAASGDPLIELRGRPGISKETIELREKELNLDKTIPERYAIWAGDVAQGDLGTTIGGDEVQEVIWRGFWVTFRMILIAAFLALFLAIVIGVVSAVKQYTWIDYAATFFAFLFFSMPTFWLAGIAKDVGIRINDAAGERIFFTIGEQTPNLTGDFVELWSDRMGHLALPTITLALLSMAAWSRFQRASMLDVLSSDYVRTARAKGLAERKVIVKHALRNALIPLTTVVAIDFAGLIGGAVITESVFAWRGLGQILIEGIRRNDVNVVTAWLFITAIVVVVANLIADIAYGLLDPRIRNA